MGQNSNRLGFETLQRDVIEKGKCSGCSSCVISCPTAVLQFTGENPCLVGQCNSCGLCLKVCQRYEASEFAKDTVNHSEFDAAAWGPYREIYVARGTDEAVKTHGQDGGVVSSLLIWGLEEAKTEGVIVSGLEENRYLRPHPCVAKNRQEVLSASGSRYTYSANLLALKEAIDQRLKRVFVVGTPCQVAAIPLLKQKGPKKYSQTEILSIGLFCSKTFTFDGLINQKLVVELGINPQEVKSCQIKGKFQVFTREGEQIEIPLKELQPYARSGCNHCGDFAAEFADISVGAIGIDSGWNIVIIRSEAGSLAFNQAVKSGKLEVKEWGEFPLAATLLLKMAQNQRKRIQKEFRTSNN